LIISVSYHEQEFFRVGYYVYNTYTDPELIENPPEDVLVDKISRNILSDKPRITRFDIKWGDEKDEENLASTDVPSLDQSTGADFFTNENLCASSNPFLQNQEEVAQDDFFNRNFFGKNDPFGNSDHAEQKTLF
jgi:Histone chaperone involved in gene silencing